MEEEYKVTKSTDEGEEAITEEEVASDEGQSEGEDAGAKEGERPAQSKEENAKFAALRREREAKEREAAKKEAEAREKRSYEEGYRKAKLEANKVNPYTEDPIEDEHDLEMYEDMKKLDDEGKDPLKAYPKFLADKIREAEKKAKEAEADEKSKAEANAKAQRELNERIANERKEWLEAYPDAKPEELAKDEDFTKLLKEKAGRWTYKEVYEKFLEDKSKSEQPAPKGTPSMVSHGTKPKKSISDMTDEEYLAWRKERFGH